MGGGGKWRAGNPDSSLEPYGQMETILRYHDYPYVVICLLLTLLARGGGVSYQHKA